MIVDVLEVEPGEFGRRTGWEIKAQGACRGELCVPLPAEARTDGGYLNAGVVAGRLGMPVLHDETHGLWSVGPASVTGRALVSAEAPELSLPDLDGEPFSLSSLRGQKVLLAAWASW
jgi:hypothetical protein